MISHSLLLILFSLQFSVAVGEYIYIYIFVGYYGNALNGGDCEPCMCEDEADSCDPYTGYFHIHYNCRYYKRTLHFSYNVATVKNIPLNKIAQLLITC